ncbi:MAG TPA: 3-deoxy-D-manno-octulosonic acid transferase [Lacipirellulaceae bacterium]|jgi:3-deoxy-D-manno-octulosonic-acid transferase|nr:3-deoxy-D-manno-octulosonic acid transferase [Lacipirellulaceae bacterium]
MARLASWLLNLVYLAIIAVALPFIIWQAVRHGKYREGYREKLFGLVPRREGNATCVWIHAVSVGEVNLVGTLLRELRAAYADWQIVVSTTSRTGYELAKKKYADLTVFYCPLDFSWAVRNAMRRVRPSLLVLAELELWPNLIAIAKQQGTKVAIINGRLSDHSFPGYRRIRPFVARVLRQIDFIAAQNDETAQRFLALGAPAERVQVTGSLKYDGAQTDRRNSRTQALRELAGITPEDVVFLAGSTQEPEEQMAIEIFRRLVPTNPRLRLILVPRHPERFDAVARLLEASQLAWQRRSLLSAKPPAEPRAAKLSTLPNASPRNVGQPPALPGVPAPVLLIDTVGELGAWWGATQVAFVGGSFGTRGGQNMLEPAAYGAAVSFGPNTRNFRDIVASLLAADAAVVVDDEQALGSFVERCLRDGDYASGFGSRARALVQANLGATARTLALLEQTLGDQQLHRGREAA